LPQINGPLQGVEEFFHACEVKIKFSRQKPSRTTEPLSAMICVTQREYLLYSPLFPLPQWLADIIALPLQKASRSEFQIFLPHKLQAATTPLSLPPTYTGFPFNEGSFNISTDTKNESRSKWAMMRCGDFTVLIY
jgi:hypothetical protein